MTFAERCSALEPKIDHVESLTRDAALFDKLDEVQKHLRQYNDELVSLLGTLKILCETGGLASDAFSGLLVRVDPLLKNITVLQKKLGNNRTKLASGDDWPRFKNESTSMAAELARALQRAWADFIAEHRSDTASLSVFRNLASCRPMFSELDHLDREMAVLAQTLPTLESTLVRIREIGKRAKELISRIQPEKGFPEKLLNLLKAAANQGGIPLSEIDDETLATLRERGFDKSLRIVSFNR